MRYTVTWLPHARNELTTIWINAPDRNAVKTAADAIDLELKRDAHLKGEEYDDVRVLVIEPVSVMFTVSPDDCLVTVTDVSRVGP